ENLLELPLLVRDAGDGQLTDSDDILFYGQGPRGYDLAAGELVYRQNPYTNTAYVWLRVPEAGGAPAGQRMASGPTYSPATRTVSTGRTRTRREFDIFNGFNSGPVWHETAIGKGDRFDFLMSTPGLRPADTTYLQVRLRGGNESGRHGVSISLNQVPLYESSPNWRAHEDSILSPGFAVVATAIATGQNIISLVNVTTSADPNEEVWLDWAELDYGIDLIGDGGARSFVVAPQPEEAQVQLSGFASEPVVLDITDPFQPVVQVLQQSDDLWLFRLPAAGAASRFVAATEGALISPGAATYFPALDFNDLRRADHQADYIIITADTLLPAAQELATIHREEVRADLRLSTLVTTVNEIYQEFSGGMVDPFAIRAFLRWAHENWQPPAPRLVALFGDGDFDYRNLSGISANLVPTIQVDGTRKIDSRTADDKFVYLDSVSIPSPLPAMGIGRIAAGNPDEAEAVVTMVRSYMVTPEPGPWRQRVILAADDPERPGTGEIDFVRESEWATGILPPFLQVIKVYLTEYSQVIDPVTNTIVKPDATDALIANVNQGVALISYSGHGGSTQWAQEQLLKMDRDRSRLQPGDRLPVWFAGTCTWGRFDQLAVPSMSEVLTATSEYAAIGVISAVREVFATPNFQFIQELFSQTFPDGQPSSRRIGQILQLAKSGGDSDEKFHLFGDPAVLLAFPREPLTVNPVQPDTLKVLGTAAYSGTTLDGAISSGEALVTVLDAPKRVTRTYITKAGEPKSISYNLPGAPIFRGTVTISAGAFQGQFVVPRDINYSGNPAALIAFGWARDQDVLYEQIGFRNDLIIRGTAEAVLDSSGPLAALYWDEREVVSGDVLPEGVALVVELQDPLGINLTGEVGHSVRVWVDEESSADVVDPLFSYDVDSYTTGRLPYQLDPALSGTHTLNVEAWDGANNRTRDSWTLHLSLQDELDVSDLFNFPNPFRNTTEFVYTLSAPAEVEITVFTLNGVKVISLLSLGQQGHGFQRLPWDGHDHFGDQVANGAYLYQLRAQGMEGQTIIQWGRLARLR
ncbi:MAG: type IX secretion system sortase PorU, partial [Candidatus Neomarinimicrobiota bacterium]